MRFGALAIVALLAACSGPKLPPPNSAQAQYDGRQQAVQVMVSSLQPPSAVALVSADGHRYPASGIALLSGPHVLYNPPPSISLGIGGFGFSGCCSAFGSGLGFGVTRRKANAGRSQRPISRLRADPFAARLRDQLDPIPRRSFGRWPGPEFCRPSSCRLRFASGPWLGPISGPRHSLSIGDSGERISACARCLLPSKRHEFRERVTSDGIECAAQRRS